jgi:cytochrome c553
MIRWVPAIAAWACLALPASAQSLAERIETCAGCHGPDGKSVQPDTPSLAGQPADYLTVQLFLFREKLRPATVMTPFAGGLSDTELQQLADHFAALEPAPPKYDPDPQAYARGVAIAQEHRCGSCHLGDLTGRGQVPRLAGQREDYLTKALRDYKSGERPGYEPAMAEVMATIPASEIADLAYFLAHFDPERALRSGPPGRPAPSAITD